MLIASLALFCVSFYMILFLYSSSVAFFSFAQQSLFCKQCVFIGILCVAPLGRALRYVYHAPCAIIIVQGAQLMSRRVRA